MQSALRARDQRVAGRRYRQRGLGPIHWAFGKRQAADPKTLEHCREEFRTGKPKGGAVQQLDIVQEDAEMLVGGARRSSRSVAWQWCVGSGCGESVSRAGCEGLSSEGLRRPRPAPRCTSARIAAAARRVVCVFWGGFGSAGECSNEGLGGDRCGGRKKMTSLLPPNECARVGPPEFERRGS